VPLHVSRVTATETEAKRQAKLFLKHAFDFNPVWFLLIVWLRSTNENMPRHRLNPKNKVTKERWRP
jgi:hypothetical protein